MRPARSFSYWIQLFVVILITILKLALPHTTFAQTQNNQPVQSTSPSNVNYFVPNTTSDVPANQHTMMQSILMEMLQSGVCLFSDIDMQNPAKGCLAVNTQSNKISYVPEGLRVGGGIGMMTNMIADLYTPPASSGIYTRFISSKFGLTDHAYAANQGYGFTSLQPLLSIWIATRNIAYLFFVLAFIAIGFAIMLRVKIDPRTVMTIQNQIPKIVIAIVMITFSYAIVGALVDIMWVSTYTVINVITSPEVGNIDTRSATINIMDNPIGYFSQINRKDMGSFDGILGITKDSAGTLADLVRTTIGNLIGIDNDNCHMGDVVKGAAKSIGSAIISGLTLNQVHVWSIGAVGSPLGECVKSITNGFIFSLSSIFMFLIMLVAIFVALFRIWFTLIKAYAFILFDTIIAPLWITAGLLPNSTLNFSSWIRHLLAHLAIFPVATAMLLLVKVLSILFRNNTHDLFVPPLIGNSNVGSNIAALVGIGVLFMIPDMLNSLRDALKSPQSKYSQGLAKGWAAGTAPVGFIGGAIGSRFWRKDHQGNPVGILPNAIGQVSASLPGWMQPVGNMLSGRKLFERRVSGGGVVGRVENADRNGPHAAHGAAQYKVTHNNGQIDYYANKADIKNPAVAPIQTVTRHEDGSVETRYAPGHEKHYDPMTHPRESQLYGDMPIKHETIRQDHSSARRYANDWEVAFDPSGNVTRTVDEHGVPVTGPNPNHPVPSQR